MIKIEHVTKFFGNKPALDDLTMTVPKGSIYGLMGLNGAGKTTLMKMITGEVIPDNGNITIHIRKDDDDFAISLNGFCWTTICNKIDNIEKSNVDVAFSFKPEFYPGDIVHNAKLEDRYPMNDVYSFDKSSASTESFHDEKILIVGDSFSGFFETFSPAYFSEVKRVEIQNFTWDIIDEYQPDFVVWEAVERYNTRFVEAGLTQR